MTSKNLLNQIRVFSQTILEFSDKLPPSKSTSTAIGYKFIGAMVPKTIVYFSSVKMPCLDFKQRFTT